MKPILNFPGYCVTEDGRVWSAPRKGRVSGQWLKPEYDTHGYLRVNLCRDGKPYPRKPHRLVLETFVGPCPAGMECCHKDGNPMNNRLDNLRWDTPSANQLDAVRHGTATGLKNKGHIRSQGEKNSNVKLTEAQVRQIITKYRTGQFFQWEIAEQYGVCRRTVSDIVRGKTWRHLWLDVNAVEVSPRRATG